MLFVFIVQLSIRCYLQLFSDIEFKGYVHGLSPVKTGKNTRAPYFYCIIQTGQADKIHAVCYDPKQRTSLQQAHLQKSPIKISGLKRLPSSSFSNNNCEVYKIKKAKVAPIDTDFTYNPDVSSSLITIKEAFSTDLFKTVDVRAKVMFKNEESKPVIFDGQRLMKVDCIIADHTESIKLALREDMIHKVDCGKSYLFKSVTVNIFDDTKYLNANVSSTVELQDDINYINLTSKEIKDHIVEGQCLGVHVKQVTSCIVICERCKTSKLKSACNKKLVCHLTMKTTTGKLEAFTCFNDGLQSFLVSINNDTNINNISHEELEKRLLHAGKRQMIVDQSEHVINNSFCNYLC